jgi:molybdopterin-guanine dinucleotide biosynthesis protein A
MSVPTALPAPDPATTTGVILAGGRGRRMTTDGGIADKALLPFRDRPMIAAVIDRFAPQVGETLINANRRHAEYARFGLRVVGDEFAGFAGPLAGAHAGLAAARHPWVLTVPCDSPFLPHDLAARMAVAVAAARVPLGVARAGGRDQPVFLLAHVGLRDGLGRFLASGEARVGRWYASLPHVVIAFDDAAAFCNINTPADLALHSNA